MSSDVPQGNVEHPLNSGRAQDTYEAGPPVISIEPLQEWHSRIQRATLDNGGNQLCLCTGGKTRPDSCLLRIIRQIEGSLKQYGCVYVTTDDLGGTKRKHEKLLEKCYNLADTFFSLPPALKTAPKGSMTQQWPCEASYTPAGKEPAYVEGQVQHVESLNYTCPIQPNIPRNRDKKHCSAMLPDADSHGFEEAYTLLWESFRGHIALPMLSALEVILSLPQGFLEQKSVGKHGANMSLMRSLKYPPQALRKRKTQWDASGESSCPKRHSTRSVTRQKARQSSEEVGISEHTDFEVLTVMHQDKPGLWLRSPGVEGQWFQATSRADVLTVIVGDMMELWTSGWLNATPHKVHSPTPELGARKSFAFFLGHDDLVKVKPLNVRNINKHACTHMACSTEHEEDKDQIGDSRSGTQLLQLAPETFVSWVRNLRGKACVGKFCPVKQGVWIRRKEQMACDAQLRMEQCLPVSKSEGAFD